MDRSRRWAPSDKRSVICVVPFTHKMTHPLAGPIFKARSLRGEEGA